MGITRFSLLCITGNRKLNNSPLSLGLEGQTRWSHIGRGGEAESVCRCRWMRLVWPRFELPNIPVGMREARWSHVQRWKDIDMKCNRIARKCDGNLMYSTHTHPLLRVTAFYLLHKVQYITMLLYLKQANNQFQEPYKTSSEAGFS